MQQRRGHEADLIPSCRKPSPHGQQIMLIDVESRTLGLEAPSEAMQLAFPGPVWVERSPVAPKESLSPENQSAVHEPKGKGRPAGTAA